MFWRNKTELTFYLQFMRKQEMPFSPSFYLFSFVCFIETT